MFCRFLIGPNPVCVRLGASTCRKRVASVSCVARHQARSVLVLSPSLANTRLYLSVPYIPR
jgi:hypothetical protein